MKVFLGGTCNDSTWRNKIISMLDIDFFNPVVDDWTEDCMIEEVKQRKECDLCLYCITPLMTGVYSIAEAIDDSNKKPSSTIIIILRDDENCRFTDGQWKSISQVAKMAESNGARVFNCLKIAANYINNL